MGKVIKSGAGFTLLELLVYVGVLAVSAALLTGILGTTLRVQTRESAANEVTSQLNFVMQNINRLVRESSLIEMATSTPTSTLTLRMKDQTKGITKIYLESGAVLLKEKNEATGVESISNLTNNRVVVDALNFTKFSQYPGHDTVSVDIQMTYNSQNPQQRASRELRSAIARVSAATFDSNLLPGSASYTVGQSGSPWQNLYISNSINDLIYFLAGNVGIGTTEPVARLTLTEGSRLSLDDSADDRAIFVPSGEGEPLVLTNHGAAANPTIRFRNDADGSDKMVVNISTGNVGIGTTGPAEKLDVLNGNIILGATTDLGGNNYGSLKFRNPSGIPIWLRSAQSGAFGATGNRYSIAVDLLNDDTSDFSIVRQGVGPIFAMRATGLTTFTGNVGIGTTAPFRRFTITDIVPIGFERAGGRRMSILWDTQASPALPDRLTFFDDTDGGTTPFRFNFANDTAYSAGGWVTGAGDLAEWIPTRDKTLEAGDILVVDDSSSVLVKKSENKTYDPRLIGVVSSKPGFILGAIDEEEKLNLEEGKILVALVGRTPVKVSTENGPIAVGDLITSSNIPGIGMKATQPGRIVGISLEAFDGANGTTCAEYKCGKIMVFINPHWWGGSLDSTGALANLTLATPDVNGAPWATTTSGVIGWLKQSLASLGLFLENGIARVKEFFVDRITAKQICLEGDDGEIICVDKNQLKELLMK